MFKLLDRYLFREFAQSTFAVLLVLLIVLLGGAFADVLRDVAEGKVPAQLLLAQLGLVFVKWIPMILPLSAMLGLMLAIGRLYRDAEMPVLVSIGIGPKRMLRPLFLLAGPVILVVGLCSLWLAPWADATSQRMIDDASRNLLIAGMEPGRFTELPGGGGVIYVGALSGDSKRMERVFVYRQKRRTETERFQVTTSRSGAMSVEGERDRYLRLQDGFEVEGPLTGDGRDYRLMRYAANELRLPEQMLKRRKSGDIALQPTSRLLGDSRPEASAQLHSRIAPPLLTLALVLLAVPLSRTNPRQARYGNLVMGFLVYLFGMFLMMLGTQWLEDGKLPTSVGLWWLLLPLLLASVWLYARDGRIRRPKPLAAARAS
ncbi:MAG: LPS export ABC transporter permease LptF [Xanthomonadaceae bacterium]|nr:LPS export ABC transporter permease LptF [Xanthomonadaceae bacterium]